MVFIVSEQHLPPLEYNASVDDSDVKFDEVDIPRNLSFYAPNLSGLADTLLPTQEMGRFLAKDLANSKNRDPPYAPYIIAKVNRGDGYQIRRTAALF